MILKKIEDGIVVSATEIKSFVVTIDGNKRATVTVTLDNVDTSEAVFSQEPGDSHIYQIVDSNDNIIRLIHQ